MYFPRGYGYSDPAGAVRPSLRLPNCLGPAALDLVPQELKSESDVHDPCFLRIQMHSQSFQDPEGVGQCRARLRRGLAGNHPVIRVPRELVALAPHLLIKWRQKYVTEQGRDNPALRSPALGGKQLPLAVASCFEHCPNQAQHSTVRYSLRN